MERVLIPNISPDIVIGGPPCQGFSVIGRMRSDDPRSKHVFHFLEVVGQFGLPVVTEQDRTLRAPLLGS